MNQLIPYIEQAFVGIIIAGASSWLTVRLSLSRFRSETLWNKKLDAYLKILDALHAERLLMERSYDNELASQNDSSIYSEAHMAELAALAKAAKRELQRVADVGSLILSSEVVDCLREALKQQLDPDEIDYVSYYEEREKTLKKAATSIIFLARADLLKR